MYTDIIILMILTEDSCFRLVTAISCILPLIGDVIEL